MKTPNQSSAKNAKIAKRQSAAGPVRHSGLTSEIRNPKSPSPRSATTQAPAPRTVFYVFEVAQKLRISEQHVLDLIEEGKIRALNIAGANASDRKFYRIPVEALNEFIRNASTLNP